MGRPTTCRTAGCPGKQKKVVRPDGVPPRDGSRYFQCQSCWHIVEQTPEGYDFEYDLGPPKRVLAEKAREEREAAERLKRWTTGRW